MTLPEPSRPARLPGYDLAPPTADDATAMLARVFGAERGGALWDAACRAVRLDPARVTTTAELQRIAESLAASGGAAATVARSLDIRLRTHARLAARAAATTGATT